MTLRALEILQVQPPALVLDLGCGTGISMEVLIEKGYDVKGIDIAEPMLAIAAKKGLDVYKADFTLEIPFESNFFDFIISISTLQWIFHGFNPESILEKGKKTAAESYRVLKSGGHAIFQFYPKNSAQLKLAGRIFVKAGFRVLEIIDDPDIPKRKKIYLLCRKTNE